MFSYNHSMTLAGHGAPPAPTLTVRLHSGGSVYSVTKQTVPRHCQAYDTGSAVPRMTSNS